ncbi:ras-responsive element-binding protein 1-like [Periplaneta americana]|uniref:ras-responsive element-binding protein 1-like n=1 Tax=Periplaneta americana TaxID=6978 RepID=UPI0037E70FBE
MQDMATMQQHSITSPAPASTIQNQDSPMDSITNANCGAEIHHEASRTDAENYENIPPTTKTINEEVEESNECNTTNEDAVKEKSSSNEDKGRSNEVDAVKGNNESQENNETRTRTEGYEVGSSDAEESCGESEMKYLCPICNAALSTQHDFTLHIRSHNNDSADEAVACLKTFTCKICSKALSSSSSLDRHVLVHSGERPFKCRICGVAFTTNGNMHRHMRTHNSPASKSESSNNYESDGSTDSGGSFNSKKSPLSSPPPGNSAAKKRRVGNHTPSPTETNNNKPSSSPLPYQSPNSSENGNKRKLPELFPSDGAESGETASRRRMKGNQHDSSGSSPEQSLHCPVCDREDFPSLNVLETHMEENHPDHQIRCNVCDMSFKSHRALNLHMIQHDKSDRANKGTKSGPQQQQSRYAVHGFPDLTFVDFSSHKFPQIAVALCEKSLHKPSSAIKFQCDKCGRAFPCATALNIHQKDGHGRSCDDDAANSDGPTDLSNNRRRISTAGRSSDTTGESEEEIEERKREDFFAGLDLQNKSIPSSPSISSEHYRPRRDDMFENSLYFNPLNGEKESSARESGKDLADIQSIISVTSAGGLIQDLSKSPPQVNMMSPDCGVRGSILDSGAGEEEQQDCFAAEFRRMKLKGEFPCRLCTAVFPNLRALKGHNRSHLSASAGLFRCNMCPYTNPDKATLVRHMRTHNGDRPYECALCNYAFTTKANCERHLRNRHSKLSREEVKKSIIYHPSEDPTNDPDLQTKLQPRDEVKKSLVFSSQRSASLEDLNSSEHSSNYQHSLDDHKRNYSPDDKLLALQQYEELKHESRRTHSPHQNIVDHRFTVLKQVRPWEKTQEAATMTIGVREDDTGGQDSTQEGDIDNETQTNENISSIEALVNLTKNNNNTFPKIPINESQRLPVKETLEMTLRHSYQSPARDVDSPLDLSMDALDLSKKRDSYTKNYTGTPNKQSDDLEPQDLSTKSQANEFNNNRRSPGPIFIKSEQSLKGDGVSGHPHGSLAQQMLTASRGTTMSPHQHSPSPNTASTLPKLDINSATPGFYGNPQLNHLYLNSNGFPFHQSQPPFALPYFIPHTPTLLQSSNMEEFRSRLQKELINNLQLSGGTLFDSVVMASAAERLQAFHQQAFSDFSRGKSDVKMGYNDVKTEDVRQPQVLTPKDLEKSASGSGISKTPPLVKVAVAPKPVRERDNSSVKMVIKNGVLMPKQKQRRYRTERPFACEHCSARFTLRSNMERHIKQQHPQYWTQRQRSNVGNSGPGRKSHPIPTSLSASLNIPNHQDVSRKAEGDTPSTQPKNHLMARHLPTVINVPEPPNDYQISHLLRDNLSCGRGDGDAQHQIMAPKIKDELSIESALAESVHKTKDNSSIVTNNNNYNKTLISEEVKQAIAQQLKSKLNHPAPLAEGVEETERRETQGREEARKDVEEDNDDDDELVIDEEKDVEEEVSEEKQLKDETKEKFSESGSRIIVNSSVKDVDLASVSRLLDNATTQTQAFQRYFRGTQDGEDALEGSEEEEEGLVAGSNSEGNNSGSDENKSECEQSTTTTTNAGAEKKKSAYSLAPNRVSCPYCLRKFPWSSSLRRHVLTHTGQKPYKCPHCPLLFTTKSNCDRHLLRKHGGQTAASTTQGSSSSSSSDTSPGSSSANYTMRNVPERPYKCNYCPSSTFSTQSNLKKHVQTKHSPASPGSASQHVVSRSVPSGDEGCNLSTAGSSRPESRYGGDESHGSGSEDAGDDRGTTQPSSRLEHGVLRQQEKDERSGYNLSSTPADLQRTSLPSSVADIAVTGSKSFSSTASAAESHIASMGGAVSSADLPFKCHLCEGSYAERQEALEHIRESHPSEFELLMSKGALDSSSSTGNEDNNNVGSSATQHPDDGNAGGEESLEQLRGKFPDYANRKVMCAFCMRRFWSAEDLRRHMRTHTGERPFSCDICRRRFTLKHSMLRHRKKHNSTAVYNSSAASAEDISVVSGDEDHPSSGTSLHNMLQHRTKKGQSEDVAGVSGDEEVVNSEVNVGKSLKIALKMTNHNNNNITPASAAKALSHWEDDSENFTASAAAKILSSKFSSCTTGPADRREDGEDDNADLIGNLLGIQGSIIDQVLQSKSAADDAAKLLGVKNGGNQE